MQLRVCALLVRRRNIIKIKVSVRSVSRSGVKDDRVKMLKAGNKLTVIAKIVKKSTLAFMELSD